MLISLILISLSFITSCSSIPVVPHDIEKINQPEYMAKLREQRPTLVKEACKANLIAKPEYRAEILNGSSMSLLIKEHYSKKMRRKDVNWADEYRRQGQAIQQMDGYQLADYYDPSDYAGFLVGKSKPKKDKNLLTHPFIDHRGIGYKVFFQIKDFQTNLRAHEFQSFAKALADAGFQGDLKVQLQPGNMRFKFNNIVVHSASKNDSFLAEKVGLKFFAGKLSGISRGVDVDIDPHGKLEALDWSEFLCTRNLSELPQDVKDYVNYK